MCGPPACTSVVGTAGALLMEECSSGPAIGQAPDMAAGSQAVPSTGQPPPGSGSASDSPQKQQDSSLGIYQTNDFKMYAFKVLPCPRRYGHAWALCPFAHPGEKARRRDVRIYHYAGVACPDMKKYNACARGDSCSYSHNDFEYWLHPQRYRTQLCKEGGRCRRKTCFFAHHPTELRSPTPILPSSTTLDLLAPSVRTGEGGSDTRVTPVTTAGDAAAQEDQGQRGAAATAAATAAEVGLVVAATSAPGSVTGDPPGDTAVTTSATASGSSSPVRPAAHGLGAAADGSGAGTPPPDPAAAAAADAAAQQLGGMLLSSLQLGGGPAAAPVNNGQSQQSQTAGGTVAALSNLDGELVLVHPDNAKLWQHLAEQQQAAGAARAARMGAGNVGGNSGNSGGSSFGPGRGGKAQGMGGKFPAQQQQRQAAAGLGFPQQQYGQQPAVLLMPPQQQQQVMQMGGGFVAPAGAVYGAAPAAAAGLGYMPTAAAATGTGPAVFPHSPYQQQQQVMFSAPLPAQAAAAGGAVPAPGGMYLPAQQQYSQQQAAALQHYGQQQQQQQYMMASPQPAYGTAAAGAGCPPGLLMAGDANMRYLQVVNPVSHLGRFDPAGASAAMLMEAGYGQPAAGTVPPAPQQQQQQYMMHQVPGSAPGQLLVNPGQPMLVPAGDMTAVAAASTALPLHHQQQQQPQQPWFTAAPGILQQQPQQLYPGPQQVWGVPGLE